MNNIYNRLLILTSRIILQLNRKYTVDYCNKKNIYIIMEIIILLKHKILTLYLI